MLGWKIAPWLKILIGLALGVCFGLVFHADVPLLTFIGKAFIDLLKMLVGLIVFSSLVLGMCHINDPKKLGRIGIKTISFYIVTTLIAIGLGLAVVLFMRPGSPLHLQPSHPTADSSALSLLDFLFSIVPSNPFAAFAQGHILQIILFAVLFALAISLSGPLGRPVLTLIESLSEVMANLTHIVMKFAPYGVFALMSSAVCVLGTQVILPLMWLTLAIGVGCLLQVALVFTLALRLLAKVKIAPFFKGMKDAIVVAFTTSSSAATLPISLECARNHLGLSPDIAGFVLSLGSTINMNGTAIGQSILALFIAQAYGIEVTLTNFLILALTTLVSAVGTAGIPGSGLIMLSVVLSAMGLPLEGIALVAGIDRIRDMFSTVVNILGDAVAAVYVAHSEGQLDQARYHSSTWTTSSPQPSHVAQPERQLN